ncbi:MAG: phosphonate metabolism protein/1,5-bisphosphokinase (PRPP-forming) PhnN, partial [Hyphomicrobiales bacterium]
MNPPEARATLFLVVGPSGAGKDSLIDGARRAFGDDRRLVFPRRVITRAPDPGSENHIAADERRFAQMLAKGAFALTWQAHGLHYGAPASIWPTLERGQSVVINISRSVISQARARYANAHVLLVTASAGALRARLATRG